MLTKAWAQTVVERVRMLDQSIADHSDLIDYKKASAVVAEMIDTIKVFENLLLIARFRERLTMIIGTTIRYSDTSSVT